MNTPLQSLKKTVRTQADPTKVLMLERFFKTGKGDYGEGDTFIGLMVPVSRRIAKNFIDLPLRDVNKLLASPIHEERFIALLIMVERFLNGDDVEKQVIYNLYLSSTDCVNNWDLVDLSADKIVGCFLYKRSRKILATLAGSKNIWERRIAIIATFYFIKQNDFENTLVITKMLMNDKHDLIHKAIGWMLREIGKRSLSTLEHFLSEYKHRLPRTSLRYAIERFPETERKKYLRGRRSRVFFMI